jgi:hypothetical protein
MTGREATTPPADRTIRDRLTHSARVALVALHRRETDDVDRDAARRLTVARLHASAL